MLGAHAQVHTRSHIQCMYIHNTHVQTHALAHFKYPNRVLQIIIH